MWTSHKTYNKYHKYTQNLQNFCFIFKLFHFNWAHINTQRRQRSADLHHSRRCWRCVPAHPVPRSVCGNPYLRTDRKNRCQSGVRIKTGHWKEKQFIQRHCGSNSTNDMWLLSKLRFGYVTYFGSLSNIFWIPFPWWMSQSIIRILKKKNILTYMQHLSCDLYSTDQSITPVFVCLNDVLKKKNSFLKWT